ncbi:MAG: orotidine-5'-phosphate decarboxylase [Phycisphaerales bacterium]|nr:orotidine-5'-phosphate decarboxylase [Phycisphaerales bacterium]
MAHPSDVLASALDRAPVCVGIDPVLERLPPEFTGDAETRLAGFSRALLDAAGAFCPVVKFQSACFERHGWTGMRALEAGIAHARSLGLYVILDAKRGDIGISASHYAAAAKNLGAHAITASPLLGVEALAPFLEAGLFVFALARTSNPEADRIQDSRLGDGRSVSELLGDEIARAGAARVGERGLSSLGAVVGATRPAQGAALRRRMPGQVFLVPGYGAQGGTADDVRALVREGRAGRAGDAGVAVSASRAIMHPEGTGAWEARVREAASRFARDVGRIVG